MDRTIFPKVKQIKEKGLKKLSLNAILFSILLRSTLQETRNSFKKWSLNLWWISNKTMMGIGNVTKAATFKSFLHQSYKNIQLLFLWRCFLMRQTLTHNFWGLYKNKNCGFHISIKLNSYVVCFFQHWVLCKFGGLQRTQIFISGIPNYPTTLNLFTICFNYQIRIHVSWILIIVQLIKRTCYNFYKSTGFKSRS